MFRDPNTHYGTYIPEPRRRVAAPASSEPGSDLRRIASGFASALILLILLLAINPLATMLGAIASSPDPAFVSFRWTVGSLVGTFAGYWLCSKIIVAVFDIIHRFVPLPWRRNAALRTSARNALIGRCLFTASAYRLVPFWVGLLHVPRGSIYDSLLRWNSAAVAVMGVAMAEWISGRSARPAALIFGIIAMYFSFTTCSALIVAGWNATTIWATLQAAATGITSILALIADVHAKRAYL
jgi:hypothetical protein